MVKRILSFISIIAILFIATGCINITSTIESIEVDKTTIPTEVTVGDFVLSNIEIIVHRTDNTSYKKAITKSMLSSDALEKLKKPGVHNIYVRYEGKLDLMTIVLLEKYPDITITFETNGGSEIQDQVITKNSKVSRPSNPIKEGYVFGGWFTDVEMKNEFSFTTTVTESLTLYAKWGSRENVVTFNGGSQVFTFTIDVPTGEKIIAPEDPVKDGYTFGGWYTDTEFTTLYNFDNIIRNSFTLYGKWIPEEYTISFNSNGGTEIASVKVLRDQLLAVPTEPIKTGFAIEGWYLDAELTQKYDFSTLVVQNFTLYAKWKIAEWTVTFATNGGSIIENISVSHEGVVPSITSPVKQDYTFSGWYLNSQLTVSFTPEMMIIEDITLYAKWTRIIYSMSFNSNGGTPIGTKTILSGEIVTKPTDPTKSGFLFAGWYVDSSLTMLYNWEGAVRENLNLHAQWVVDPNIPQERHTIIFDPDGGSEVNSIEVVENEKAIPPTSPTKEGYTFGGWYIDITDENAFDFNTPIIHDYVLIAKWLSNHTVTFLDHVGNILKVQTIGDGLAATAPIPPVREGYDFRFWNVAFTEVRYDLTVRPIYVVSTYIVVFKDADGTILSEQTIEYGSDAVLPADPDLMNDEGYHFIGWDKVTTDVASDLVVTAKYAINTYMVTYVDYNGNVLKTQEVPHNGKATNIAVDVPYLELLGWYQTNEFVNIFRFDTTIITANVTIYGKFEFKNTILREIDTTVTPNKVRILSWNVQGITDLIVPEYLNGLKVTALGNLLNTDTLKSVTLPKYIETISYSSLLAITSLESISIASAAANFTTVNGVLYNKAKTSLLLYPKGKADIEFTLENTVTTISNEAFKDTSKLIRVIFPSTITTLGDNIFANANVSVADFSMVAGVPATTASTFNGVSTHFKVVVASDKVGIYDAAWTVPIYSTTQRSGDFLFVEAGTTITILQYLGSDINVTVPTQINTKDVTIIESYAFFGLTGIRGLILPSTVVEIKANGLLNLDLEYLQVDGDIVIPVDYKAAFESGLANTIVYVPTALLSGTNAFSELANVYDKNIIIGEFAMIRRLTKYGILQYLGDDSEVIIPNTIGLNVVSFVEGRAFDGLENLEVVKTEGVNLVNFAKEFNKDVILVVPDNLLDEYLVTYENTAIYPNSMVMTKTSEYIYGELANKITIIRVLSWSESITIPATIGGKAVESIGRFAIYYMPITTAEVVVPQSIKYLSDYALYNDNDIDTSIRFLGACPTYIGYQVCHSEDVVLVASEYFNIYLNNFTECSVHNIGSVIAQSDDFRYSIYNNSIGIVKYIGTAKNVVVPAVINGMTVASIYAMAFANNSTVETISLPTSITYIGYKAFQNCLKLNSVTVNSLVVPKVTVLADNWILFYVPNVVLSSYLADYNWSKYQIYKTGTVILENTYFKYIIDSEIEEVIVVKYLDTEPEIDEIRKVAGYFVGTVGAYAFYDNPATSMILDTSVHTLGYKALPKNITQVTLEAEEVHVNGEYVYEDLIVFTRSYDIAWYRSNNYWSNYDIYEEDTVFLTYHDLYLSYYSGTITILEYRGTADEVIIDQTINVNTPYGAVTGTVVAISKRAFYDNTMLEEITLPSTITKIGEYAFYNCSSLISITGGSGITEVGIKAFHNTEWYNNATTTQFVMFGNVLYKYNQISGVSSNVTVPANVKTIADYAFSGVTTIATVIISNTVTSIGTYAFAGCTNLTGVTIVTGGINRINDYTFAGCTRLRNITIPASVVAIGKYAFTGCSTLDAISFGTGVRSIEDFAFKDCTQLVTIALPRYLSSIGKTVFAGCNNLVTVTLDTLNTTYKVTDSILLTKNGETIIQDLIPLTRLKLTIPATVKKIEAGAFVGSKFTEVIIGANNILIMPLAFDNNTNLTRIIIKAIALPMIEANSFGDFDRYVYVYGHMVTTATADEHFGKYEIKPIFSFASTSVNVVITEEFTNVAISILDTTGYTITYSSSDTEIIRYVNGKLIGVKIGTATITATLNTDPTQTCTIKVNVIAR